MTERAWTIKAYVGLSVVGSVVGLAIFVAVLESTAVAWPWVLPLNLVVLGLFALLWRALWRGSRIAWWWAFVLDALGVANSVGEVIRGFDPGWRYLYGVETAVLLVLLLHPASRRWCGVGRQTELLPG